MAGVPLDKKRRSWFEPGHGVRFDIAIERNVEEDTLSDVVETLVLTPFSRPPIIDFGNVPIGSTKSCQLLVRNPHSYCQQVVIDKFPLTKKFTVDLKEFAVEAGGETLLNITWNPEEVDRYRETVTLKSDQICRLQFVIIGTATNQRSIVKKKTRVGVGLSNHSVRPVLPTLENLSECKENVSPSNARSQASDLVFSKFSSECGEDILQPLTPVRRSTFVKTISPVKSRDQSFSSPSNMLKFEGGYKTENGSPVAIPDCLSTPVRRTTFVKRDSKKLVPQCTSFEKGSPTLRGSPIRVRFETEVFSQRDHNSERSSPQRQSLQGVTEGARIQDVYVAREIREMPIIRTRETCSVQDHCSSSVVNGTQLFKDVCQSPQLLEEKLLSLQQLQANRRSTDKFSPTCQQSSPESEYHTATMTTPFDDSLNSQFQDSLTSPVHDSMLSQTITDNMACLEIGGAFDGPSAVVSVDAARGKNGRTVLGEIDLARCCFSRSNETYRVDTEVLKESQADLVEKGQPQWSLKASQVLCNRTVLLTGDQRSPQDLTSSSVRVSALDRFILEDNVREQRVEYLNESSAKEPKLFNQDVDVMTSTNETDAVIIQDNYYAPFKSEFNTNRQGFPSMDHVDVIEHRLSSTPALFRRMADVIQSSAMLNKWLPRTSALSPIGVEPISAIKGTALHQVMDDGCFRRPLPAPVAAVPRSHSVPASNHRTKAASLNCSQVERNFENRTFVKHASNESVSSRESEDECVTGRTFIKPKLDPTVRCNTSNRKPSSRHLFGSASDSSDVDVACSEGIEPLDATGVDGFENTHNTVGVSSGCSLPDGFIQPVELSQRSYTVHYSSNTETGEMSGMRCVSSFQQVGGQTSHMLSPGGEKRQSLIAKMVSRDGMSPGEKSVAFVRSRNSTMDRPPQRSRSLSICESNDAKKPVVRDKSFDHVRGPKKPDNNRTNCSVMSVNTRGRATVAQSKLALVKPQSQPKPAVKYTMPYAARNMYYDERWMEKQQRGFTKWLNFVLTPPEMYFEAKKQKVDVGSIFVGTEKDSVFLAPTKEYLSLCTYNVRTRMNRLRRASCNLFQSNAMTRVIEKIECEIETGRMAIRTDRMLHADLGIKQRIIDMLLSYNPLWLRIGLETIYGEVLNIHSNSDIVGLSRFILTQLLGNPDIAVQFAHPSVRHLYKPGYQNALAKFTLKKFLLLVIFLDKAKSSHLIDYNPCLFCRDADFKSSRDILLAFSRDYLRGEGDLTRHLGYLGYTVCHVQSWLDEYDYAVTNLATDLRDGLKLTRLIDILVGQWHLSSELRGPAISRMQKIHNVSLVFNELAKRGITVESTKGGKVEARDIVDGHRQKTLQLLWALIFVFKVDVLLDETQLISEISRIQRRLSSRQLSDLLAVTRPLKSDSDDENADSGPTSCNSPRLALLLEWCQTVCFLYDLKVENFTVSFSDGRAFCYLLHHYYPAVISLADIRMQTSVSCGVGRSSIDVDSDNDKLPSQADLQQLYANEKHNFKLLFDKVSVIGGVPIMLNSNDMSNTIPDEKTVITYLSYLLARLLDVRNELHAAYVIQTAWRKYKLLHVKETCDISTSENQEVSKGAGSNPCDAEQSTQPGDVEFGMNLDADQLEHNLDLSNVDHARHDVVETTELQAIEEPLKSVELGLEVDHAVCIDTAEIALNTSADLRNAYVSNIDTAEIALNTSADLRNACVSNIDTAEIALNTSADLRNACVSNIDTAEIALNTSADLRNAYVSNIDTAEIALNTSADLRNACISNIDTAENTSADFRNAYVSNIDTAEIALNASADLRNAYVSNIDTAEIALNTSADLQNACISNIDTAENTSADLRNAYVSNIDTAEIALNTSADLQNAYISNIDTAENTSADLRNAYVSNIDTAEIALNTSADLRNACVSNIDTADITLNTSADLGDVGIDDVDIQYAESVSFNSEAILISMPDTRQADAATKIQAVFRSYADRKRYKVQMTTVCSIQRCVRSWLHCRWFHTVRGAALTIQCAYRGYRCRRRYLVMMKSVCVIQSWFRGQSSQQHFQQLLNGVSRMQRHARALLVSTEMTAQSSAAVRIQAVYRGYRVRECLKSARKVASDLRLSSGSRLTKLVHSATVSGLSYSGVVELVQQTAAIKLQSVCFTYRYKKMCAAVRTVQRSLRTLPHRMKFQTLRVASVVLQRRWRAVVVGREDRRRYLICVGAAILMQSTVQGFLARSKYRRLRQQHKTELNSAAVKMQSIVRCYLARCELRRLRQQYETKLNSAAVKLQCTVRGYLARCALRQLRQQYSAAVKIQSAVRMSLDKKQFLTLRRSVIILQSFYRGHRDRLKLVKLNKCATIIQRCYRRHREHQTLKTRSAVRIQSFIRMVNARQYYEVLTCRVQCLHRLSHAYIYRKRLEDLRQSAITLQRHWRARQVRRHETVILGAVIVIQSTYRGYQDRKSFLTMKQGFTRLAAIIRGRQGRSQYLKKHDAVLALQRRYRARVEGKICRQQLIKLKLAVLCIQSVYRGRVVRQILQAQGRAAVCIQSAVRGFLLKKRFVDVRQSAIKIQSAWRSFRARKSYLHQRNAAIVLQNYYRGYVLRLLYVRLKTSIVSLQATGRGVLARKKFFEKRNSVLQIQRVVRGFLARKQFAFERTTKAAKKIQGWYRARKERDHFVRQVVSARVLQTWWRNVRLTRVTRQRFLITVGAAVTVQSAVRGLLERKRYQRMLLGFCRLQATHRMHHVRMNYVRTREAVIKVQRWFRGHLEVEKQRKELNARTLAAVRIQAVLRGHRIRECLATAAKVASNLHLSSNSRLSKLLYSASVSGVNYLNLVELVQRTAVSKLHASFCAYRYKKLCADIRTAQRSLRTLPHQINFQSLRTASVVLQRRWRAVVIGRDDRRRYLIQIGAAILIQSTFRGYLASCEYRKFRQQYETRLNSSALKMQSTVRGFLARCELRRLRQHHETKLKLAAVKIQSTVRSFLAKRELRRLRQQYETKLKLAAVKMQCTVRGYLARCELRRLRQQYSAAVKIQSAVRMSLDKKRFVTWKRSVIILQSFYRSHRDRLKLVKLNKCATIIQRCYRRHREHQTLKTKSVVRIQSFIRMVNARQYYEVLTCRVQCLQRFSHTYIYRKRLKDLRQSAITLQRHWRARQVRRHETVILGAVIVIQSTYRGYRARKSFLTMKQGLTRLAAIIRGRQGRSQYLKKHDAVLALQRRYRARVEGKICRQQLIKLKLAVLCIQSVYRGRVVRQILQAQGRAAVCIQSAVRGFLLRKRFVDVRQSAIKIQSAWRSFRARKSYLHQHNAAIVLQKYYRGYVLRLLYVRLKTSIVSLQATGRGVLARKKFFEKRNSVLQIQRVVRGFLARKQFAFERTTKAAKKIQGWYRARKERDHFVRQVVSARVLQTWWRNVRLTRVTRQRFLITVGAAVTIQSAVRGLLERKRYQRMLLGFCRLQATHRMHHVRMNYVRTREAVIKVQRWFRGHLEVDKQRKELNARTLAAVRIQAVLRGHRIRECLATAAKVASNLHLSSNSRLSKLLYSASVSGVNYLNLVELVQRTAVSKLHASFCAYRYKKLFAAIRTAQRSLRTLPHQINFQSLRAASVVLQRRWRAVVIGREDRRQYLIQIGAAILIQSTVRGYLAGCVYLRLRQQYETRLNVAAVNMQSAVRGYLARSKYRRLRQQYEIKLNTAAVKLQSTVRGYFARCELRRLRQQYEAKVNTAAVKMQSIVRGYLARCKYRRLRQQYEIKLNTAAVKLQSTVRGYFARCELRRLRQQYEAMVNTATIKIQSTIRGYFARCKYRRLRQQYEIELNIAAVKLQSTVRGYLARCELRRLRQQYEAMVNTATIKIQSTIRGYFARCKYRRLRQQYEIELNIAAVKLQSTVRSYLARCELRRLRQQYEAKINSAAVKIQAIWHGYRLRQQIKDKKINEARFKVLQAAKCAEEKNKLCHRTSSALDYLLTYKQLSHVLEALMNLEVVTRLSPKCCQRLVQHNAVNVVFRLIRNCNRSLPHMELIKQSISILLNLTKYEVTAPAVVEASESIETLVELLQIYREKGVIFSSTCTLLGLMGCVPLCREMVLGKPAIIDKLRSIQSLTLRKHEIEQKRLSTKARLAASANFLNSSSCCASSALLSHNGRHRIVPAWAMRRDTIHSIDDPVAAINFMLSALHIPVKR